MNAELRQLLERCPGYSKEAQQEFMENIRKLEEQPQSRTKQILILKSEHLGEWHQIDPPNIEQGVDKNLTLSQTIDSTNLNVENTPFLGNDNSMPLGTPSSLVSMLYAQTSILFQTGEFFI